MLLEDLPTPCLLIERRRLMQNLDRMQAHATAQAVALRPHVKTHKSIHIAREQVARGAQGLTLAKPSEAAVFAEAGFCNLRIAYPVVGPTAHEQLLGLKAQVSFCVDTAEGLHAAAPVYAAHDCTADVLLEVDTGYGRTGVPWDHADLVALARLVEETPGVRLVGLLTHAGQSYDGPQAGETAEAALQRVAHEERDRLLEAAQRLHEAGVAAAQPGAFELSLGATPSIYHLENRSYAGFRITEIRPGTYVFMDGTQVGLGAATWQDCALTVMATVVSKRRDATGSERFYVDA
ncbi:MAG: alanine racemase, partial [Bacteroidota bacterium]